MFLTGSQFIAINFDSNDLGLLIYYSQFEINNRENYGFILKPECMLHDRKISPFYPIEYNKPNYFLEIIIISGHYLRPEKDSKKNISIKNLYHGYIIIIIKFTKIKLLELKYFKCFEINYFNLLKLKKLNKN